MGSTTRLAGDSMQRLAALTLAASHLANEALHPWVVDVAYLDEQGCARRLLTVEWANLRRAPDPLEFLPGDECMLTRAEVMLCERFLAMPMDQRRRPIRIEQFRAWKLASKARDLRKGTSALSPAEIASVEPAVAAWMEWVQ